MSVLISRKLIPYEVINKILDYVSQLNDTQFRLDVDYKGKLAFRVNIWFSGWTAIRQVNMFKQAVRARQVRLRISIWPNIANAAFEEVDAIEEPRRICDQENTDADYAKGFVSDGRCYTYSKGGQVCHAYVESRHYYAQGVTSFRYGSVYEANGNSYSVSAFGASNGNLVEMTVNPMNIWWEVDEAADMDAAEALLGLHGGDEEIDFYNLPALQMYM